MVAFHMFCHEDARRARAMARPPFEEYFRALTESVGDWACGTTSKDYRDYDTSMRRLRSFTLDSQIASGGAWVGTPDEIKAMIARVVESIGQFEHASLQINFGMLRSRSTKIDAAVRARGAAGICRAAKFPRQPCQERKPRDSVDRIASPDLTTPAPAIEKKLIHLASFCQNPPSSNSTLD